MPTKSRAMPKSSGQSQARRGSRQPRVSQETSTATTMDIRNDDAPHFSYSSSLPYRRCHPGSQVTDSVTTKDQSCSKTSYAQPTCYLADSDPSFTAIELPYVSGVPWDSDMPMDNLILEPCQPFITNEPYQYPEPSESLTSGAQSLFDQVAFDSSINLSNAQFPGYNVLAPGMMDDAFKHDFPSGPMSYDSGSSVYTSPPTSPELQGQNWPGMPGDYSADGQYTTHGNYNLAYPHLTGFSPQAFSPLSPPMSDDDPLATLTCIRSTPNGRQPSAENSMDFLGNSKSKSIYGRHCGSDPGTTATLATLATSYTPGSTQSSRPVQRILKPASEKPKVHDLGSQPTPLSAHAKPKEKPETVQPRNHHLYKITPGQDGLFRCPFASETQCAHMPTKQKCGYE